MKNSIKHVSSLIVILLIFNLSLAQVNSDFDKSVDFTQYKTISFSGWQKNSEKLLNDLDKQRMLKAFRAEFESRNISVVSENADAVVTLYLVIDKKTSTTAYTDFNGGMGMGYGMGVRRGWGMGVGGVGMGSATTTFNTDDYNEGTLVIDFYDAPSKKLVWQGSLQSVISDKTSKRDKTIPKKVGKLMKKFPIQASK